MAELTVHVVAADRKVWEGAASQVSARSVDGELGIMPGHAPILTILAEGDIAIKTAEGTQKATIDGGFLSVDHNVVTILAETVDASGLTK